VATRIGRYGVSLRDARGQVGRVGGYLSWIDTDAAHRGAANLKALSIAGDLANASNGYVLAYTGMAGEIFLPNGLGSTAQFQNAEDKARLTMLTAGGSLHTFEVPMPKATAGDNGTGIFKADLETVDLACTEIAAIVASLTSVDASGNFAASRDGSAFVGMVAGIRVRRRFQRKTTIWTLTPDELEPEE